VPKNFAVFDIDGTLIRWQMFHAIVHHLGKKGVLDPKIHNKVRKARMDWKNRNTTDSFKIYEKLLVEEYLNALTDIDTNAYNGIVIEVFNEYKDQLFVYTRDLLNELKNKGYFTIAISGSHDEIIKMLGEYLGFDISIGAILDINNGRFTGDINTPVFAKDEVLNEIITKYNLTYKDSYGIGDSEGDIPILKIVENPIAFNPSKELYNQAKKHQWPIVIERKNVIYKLRPSAEGYTLSND
jgi:HAD superfamily hydrolase (TIGR01490 family)